MAAIIAVLLTLLPFGIYLTWRRYGPSTGEPSSGMIIALLLGVGLMLGVAVWYGLSRSFERHADYVPAQLGPDGRVLQGRSEPSR
jgi:Zn-dependent protease with chaperone function